MAHLAPELTATASFSEGVRRRRRRSSSALSRALSRSLALSRNCHAVMVLVLVLGDMHVPHRAAEIPKAFRKLLVPGKIQHIVCTGNIVDKATWDYLKSLCPEVHAVRGDFDDSSFLPHIADTLTETKVVTIGQFKIGVCHGHQVVPWGDPESLGALQRQLDCDILVSGHTHRFAAYEYEGKLFINPGSATGAYDAAFAAGEEPTPSFVLMDLQGQNAVTYVYEMKADEVKVKKVDHTKATPQSV